MSLKAAVSAVTVTKTTTGRLNR